MANKNSRLLSTEEQWDIYSVPVLTPFERAQYFTLNPEEIKTLKSFRNIESSVYFAICLVFLKLKGTLVNFKYQDVTLERQYIMEHYFPTRKSPRSFPSSRDSIATIENKALSLCGYHRCTEQHIQKIQTLLQQQAAQHPRQRKLCKILLDLFAKHRLAIPPYSLLQSIVTKVWNKENQRIVALYHRHTTKKERKTIYSLLDKTDEGNRIVSLKQDMRGFNNAVLKDEIEKLKQLKPIFTVATRVLPKLKLPTTAISYYAGLIDYYNGYRLKELGKDQVQLYLLCYSFIKYQEVNDNLLEAFKKRTLDYQAVANQSAKDDAAKQLKETKKARIQASHALIAIHDYKKESIPKQEVYKHIPKNELLVVAKRLVDENLDRDYLYWKYIDSVSEAIKLSVRQLFLNIDFVITKNEALKKSVEALLSYLNSPTKSEIISIPIDVQTWIKRQHQPYVLNEDTAIANRFEFLIYENITHHISTNKLTLKHTLKHKNIEDYFVPLKTWEKHHTKILRNTGYKALNTPIAQLLAEKKKNVTMLYKSLNEGILSGENKGIKVTISKDGRKKWRLRPLVKKSDPNESFFAEFPRRSVVNVTKLVNQETGFYKVFDPILTKQIRSDEDFILVLAAIIANGMRIGCRKMADISDLNESSLLTAEASYLYNETIQSAIDVVNKKAAEIPIFKKWYLHGKHHGSADGFKLEVELKNAMARYSKKYFGTKMGVSSYNSILNHFSITGYLISPHEYEGDHTFEMAEHQNAPELKIDILSTDKHGSNTVNYGLFDLTDRMLAPRIPRPHREIFWGFKDMEMDENYLIKPTKFADEPLIVDEWNNAQRFVASLITGDAKASIVIKKMTAKNYSSRTKRAFIQYNHLVRTEFLLLYLQDEDFRRAVLTALNRGEAYNNLYRAIAILKKGALKGNNKVEMEMWNQCTRLISSIILYYNTYILNGLYEKATDEKMKGYLLSLSPGAWIHINFLGLYKFFGEEFYEEIDRWIQDWDFEAHPDLLKKPKKKRL